MLVDTHAHLTSEQFDADRKEVIRRSLDAGVGSIVLPSIDVADSRRGLDLASTYDELSVCVGIHPHEAKEVDERALREIEDLSSEPKVVAIGEIGLDYFYDFSPREAQREVFRRQLGIAMRRNLPVVIHTRDSIDDTVWIVEEFISANPGWRMKGAEKLAPRGVFHCFSGDFETARKVIGMRFYVSFPGIVTFRNALQVHHVAASVPIEDLLIETDSPFMAPVPLRGKRNEPANVKLIADRIADLKKIASGDVERITAWNAYDLFGVGEEEPPDAA